MHHKPAVAANHENHFVSGDSLLAIDLSLFLFEISTPAERAFEISGIHTITLIHFILFSHLSETLLIFGEDHSSLIGGSAEDFLLTRFQARLFRSDVNRLSYEWASFLSHPGIVIHTGNACFFHINQAETYPPRLAE